MKNKNLLFGILFLMIISMFSVSALSTLNYDLSNFCDVSPNQSFNINLDDYLTIDYNNELAVCYMSVCTGGVPNTVYMDNPVCIKNGELLLDPFYWNASLLYDVFNINTYDFTPLNVVGNNEKCVAVFGLAECNPEIDDDNCYNRLFYDGGWEWLPSDRYNDKMNIHSVFEYNDPSFTLYDFASNKGWGDFVGDYCSDTGFVPVEDVNDTLDDNLFGYFRFDNNAFSDPYLTVTTSGIMNFSTSGVLGNSYFGNGLNSQIFVSGYPLVSNHNWTYNFWVAGDNSNGVIFDSLDPTQSYGHIKVFVENDYLKFQTGGTILTTYPMTDNFTMNTITLTDGQFRYYRDGSLIYTHTPNTTNVDFSTNIVIGADWYGDNHFFGSLDELSFYGRSLTSDEIVSHFNGGNSVTYDGNDFVDTPPNYEIDLLYQHPNKTLSYNDEYCFDADYYFDNADSFSVGYNVPPTSITETFTDSINSGFGTLHSDYYDVSLGGVYGRPDSEVCVFTFERDTNFSLELYAEDIFGGWDLQYINFFVDGNFSSNVYVNYPYQYYYTISPDNPSQDFSFNYFYSNYDTVSVTFNDGVNTTLSCSLGDNVVHNYTGNLSIDLECDDSNVYLYIDSLNFSWDGVFYTNVSNSNSNVTDYFNLRVLTGVPDILSYHNDTSMAFYSTYTDIPESYFSNYDEVGVLLRIPLSNNYRYLSKGDSLANYTSVSTSSTSFVFNNFYTFNYKSDGNLTISTGNTPYYSCIFYIAKNSFGETQVSYLNTISEYGLSSNDWNCSQVYDIVTNDPDGNLAIDGYDWDSDNSFISNQLSSFLDVLNFSGSSLQSMKMTFLMILLVFGVGVYSVFKNVKITLLVLFIFGIGSIVIMTFFSSSLLGVGQIVSPKWIFIIAFLVVAFLIHKLGLFGGGE